MGNILKVSKGMQKNFGRNLFIGGRCWDSNHWPQVMKATVQLTDPPLISSMNEVWPFYVSALNMSITNSEEGFKTKKLMIMLIELSITYSSLLKWVFKLFISLFNKPTLQQFIIRNENLWHGSLKHSRQSCSFPCILIHCWGSQAIKNVPKKQKIC